MPVTVSGCLLAMLMLGLGVVPAAQALGPAANLTLALSAPTVTADGVSTVTAKASVTDALGLPVAGETIVISSSDPNQGISPSPAHDNLDGTYSATITSSTTAGPVTITATDTSTAGIPPVQQPLTQTPGPATQILLGLQPSSITADGSSTSTATASVADAHGNAVSNDNVVFSSNNPNNPAESFSPTAKLGNGVYTASITSSHTAGSWTITATDSTTAISNSQTLNETAGTPTKIGLALQHSTITADGTSKSKATATVTDAFGNPVSGETIVISSSDAGEGISPSPAHDNLDGTYTATITSSTTAGRATITATDTSTAGITPAQQTLTQNPGLAANIALTLQPPVIAADGISQSLATATVTDAHNNPVAGDTVRFSSSNPAERIFPLQPAGNTYTASIISSTHPGSSTITATDSTVGISNQQTLKEVAGTSTTTLVTSPASPVSTNHNVTLFATVTGSGGTPSGTVRFIAGFLPIAGCTSLPVSPSHTLAICQTSFAASQSPVQIAAVFTPDLASSVAGSSTAGILSVAPGSTSTTLTASSPTVRIGATETYTAFVSPGNQGAVAPSGSVKFQDRGKTIQGCANVPVRASGGALTASCSVSYSTRSTRRVTATYSGDQNFNGSSSNALQVPVQALGVITSSMQWRFRPSPRYTTVSSLVVNGVSLGTKVIITCQGHRCPFAKRISALSGGVRCTPTGKHHCGRHGKGPIDLTGPFHRHRLVVGTRITVEILRPGWVGKFYLFLVRSSHLPQVRISCLAPGASKPGIGC